MLLKIYLAALVATFAVGTRAEGSFAPAQSIHIEPLGAVDISPNKLLADTVILQLVIDKEGRVTDATVWSSSGDEAIDAAALAAARKCLFAPATQDGEPVESWYQIYYRLSAHKTMEYVGPEGKTGTAEAPPATAEDNAGRD